MTFYMMLRQWAGQSYYGEHSAYTWSFLYRHDQIHGFRSGKGKRQRRVDNLFKEVTK